MKSHGKVIPGLARANRGKLFQIIVELKDVPGALASVASILAKAKMNILSGMTFVSRGKYGVWSIIVQQNGHNLSAKRLKNLIDSSTYVTDSLVKVSQDNILLDKDFPVLFGDTGIRLVLMRQKQLSEMFEKIRNTFGSGGDAIIYQEGMTAGRDAVDVYSPILGKNYFRENFPQTIPLYTSLGWGEVTSVNVSRDLSKVTVRIKDSFECDGKKSEKPYSQFIRGHLCGAISARIRREMKCVEVKCVAKGDEYCEYVVTRA